MYSIFIILISILLLLGLIRILSIFKDNIKFYISGFDSGFKPFQISLLWKLAKSSQLTDPTALFWSVPVLDKTITQLIAAEKMKKQKIPVSSGTIIEYYIGETKQKTKKISDKVYLPNEKQDYDIEYYLNNQIIPAIENIFEVFNVDIRRLIKSKTQTSLGDF